MSTFKKGDWVLWDDVGEVIRARVKEYRPDIPGYRPDEPIVCIVDDKGEEFLVYESHVSPMPEGLPSAPLVLMRESLTQFIRAVQQVKLSHADNGLPVGLSIAVSSCYGNLLSLDFGGGKSTVELIDRTQSPTVCNDSLELTAGVDAFLKSLGAL